MNAKEKELWADMRAKGKFRYIALYGVIITGGLYALVMTLAGYFIEYGLTFSDFLTYFMDSRTHMRFFLFATAFGLIMGVIKWNRNEKAFAEAQAKDPAESV
jgi:hypothetical protein